MNTHRRERHNILSYGRQVKTGLGLQFYYHEAHVLFDEVIAKP